MISQEEVCIWFKNLEGYSRIELMCALLDSCLPLELRFLGTYLEYSAGKHYTHLQKWEKDANKSSSLLTASDSFSNKEFRRKFCIFLALLHSHNRTIAVKLFEVLNKWEYISDNENINSTSSSNKQTDDTKNDNDSFARKLSFYNEMRLLFTMASLHPALDFSQRSNLRTKKENFASTCSKPEPSTTSTTDVLQEGGNMQRNAKPSENHLKLEEVVEQGPVEKSVIPSTSIAPVMTTTITSSQTPLSLNVDVNKTINTIPPTEPAQFVSRSATGQNLPQLSLEKFYQMPPYRTHVLLPRSQLPGAVIHKPQEQQHMYPVMQRVPPPVQCVVNNRQFIQNNISLHTNTTTKSDVGNVFSPTERGIGLSRQSLLNTNVIQPSIPLVSPNIYTTRTLDSLSGTAFAPPDTRKQFPTPHFSQHPKIANGPIMNPSLDDSSLPSHVYAVNIKITCNGLLKDTSTLVTTLASTPAHNISHRCLSESDAQERLHSGQEHLLNNIVIPKSMPLSFPIPVEQKTDGTLSNIHFYNSLPSGYSPVCISNLNANNPNYQTINLTENNSKQVVYSYNSPQSQHQQPTVQSQQPPVSCNITNSPLLPTHFVLPTTTNEDRSVLSPNKTIPTGINGTYFPAHVLEGIRPSNVCYNDIDKLEPIANKNQYNMNISTSKSLPIPVQSQRRNFSTGKFPPDIVESPCSSPSQSPKPSPFCSPTQSPISQRKGVSSPKLETQDIYASTTNWLKSMRLHKYSDTLENYSFEELKELDEEDFKQLGLTVGASNKIKQQIELLSSRGLKEFGHPENLINFDLPYSGGSSNVSPASLSPVIGRNLNAGIPQPTSHPQNTEEIPRSPSLMIDMNQHDDKKNIEKENPLPETSKQKQMETIESSPTNSDDDVFGLRKRSELATCYNCGHVGHYGDECTEQTMESLTYSRYSFQLDYSRSTQEQPTTADDTKKTTTTITANR